MGYHHTNPMTIFDSARSSSSANVCPSVCAAQTCLTIQSIQRATREQSESTQRAIWKQLESNQSIKIRVTVGAYKYFSCNVRRPVYLLTILARAFRLRPCLVWCCGEGPLEWGLLLLGEEKPEAGGKLLATILGLSEIPLVPDLPRPTTSRFLIKDFLKLMILYQNEPWGGQG